MKNYKLRHWWRIKQNKKDKC